METVERTVTLPTDLEEAWTLLTDPDDLTGWLGAEVDLEPTPGRPGTVVDHDGTRRHLVVDEVEVGRRLTWRWWVDGDDAPASAVEVSLTPTLDGTLVTVTERLVSAGSAQASAATVAEAWSHRLVELEMALMVAAAVRV